MAASEGGYADCVRRLLDHGADHTVRYGSTGENALFDDCNQGHVEVVKVVMEKGMDVNRQVDNDGMVLLL